MGQAQEDWTTAPVIAPSDSLHNYQQSAQLFYAFRVYGPRV